MAKRNKLYLTYQTLKHIDEYKNFYHRIEAFNAVLPLLQRQLIREYDHKFKAAREPVFAVMQNIPEVIGMPLHPEEPWLAQIVACSHKIKHLEWFMFWFMAGTLKTYYGCPENDSRVAQLDDFLPCFKVMSIKNVEYFLREFNGNEGNTTPRLRAIWDNVVHIYAQARLKNYRDFSVTKPLDGYAKRWKYAEEAPDSESVAYTYDAILPIKSKLDPYKNFFITTEEDWKLHNWQLEPQQLIDIQRMIEKLEFILSDGACEIDNTLVEEGETKTMLEEQEEGEEFDFDFDYEFDYEVGEIKI